MGASDDRSDFYQLLVELYKDSQPMGKLVLSLATLLSFNQLMLDTLNIAPFIGRSHLDDFDAHMRGAALDRIMDDNSKPTERRNSNIWGQRIELYPS